MKLITQILHPYKRALGEDYNAYHNHAQRVYQYAIMLLLVRESPKLAVAAAFHDLDIWTGKTMDYLPGSSGLAMAYLKAGKLNLLPEEVAFIIENHHKLTGVKGNLEAEAFRKADFIDLTAGHIHFNMPVSLISDMEKRYPRYGFTKLIVKKSTSYAFRKPLRPFPMLKW